MTKTYNIITHGDVVNTNGVLSNFSRTNYATLPIKLPTGGVTQLELDLEFTTGPDVTTERCLISQTTKRWNGFKIDIDRGHLWIADVSTDAYTSNYTFSINTLYYIKLLFDGTGYNLYISTDGKNYDTQESFGNSVFKTQPNEDLYLGSMNADAGRYFNGTINLSGCSLIINNQLVWRGITTTVNPRIQLRHDTAANWTSVNPVLAVGEMGVETDTKKLKIGDGTTAYTQLEYFSAGGGGSTDISATLPLKIVDGVISLEVDGQTIQIVDGKLHANLIDADRIEEQLATKTDMLQASGAGMPSNRYIDLTLGSSGSTYTAPANGYYTLYKIATGSGQYIQMANVGYDNESVTNMVIRSVSNNDYVGSTMPCAKGKQIRVSYTLGGNTVYFRFCYAEGEQ